MKTTVALLLLAAVAPAAAQETQDTFLLGEVIVSAARLPQKVGSVPAAVTIFRHEEFTRLGMRNVADVVRTVSGAAVVQPGSFGALSSLFLRGGESDYVQVLLDGVQINSPGELFDFSGLSLENIARIEVVKGPVSVLYGSDAVAGVIQLFSQEGTPRIHSRLTLLAGRGQRVGTDAAGHFGTTDMRADVSGRLRRLDYAVGISDFDTEGALAYNNRHRLSSGTIRLSGGSDRTSIAFSGRLTRNLFHYPTDGSGNLTDGNQFHEADGDSRAALLESQPGSHRRCARLARRHTRLLRFLQ
jgi:vitamin B12 transporter